jgi:HPt (histidine-containing phosphotransfer) domain-containing protein
MKLLKKPVLILSAAGAGCYTWLLLSVQVAVPTDIFSFALVILALLYLRESRQQYRNLIQTSNVLSCTCNRGGYYLQHKSYDCIIMDIRMPGMNGSINPANPITIHLNHNAMSSQDGKPFQQNGRTPQPGVVDFNHLRSLLFNDNDYIKEMLEEFLVAMPANIQEMREASEQQQWARVAFLAHRLKSSLGIVPITNALELTRELETDAHQAKDAAQINGKVEGLAALLERACNEIREHIKPPAAS